MANFTVSLKKLTEKVSMDVVYAPQDLENISVEIAEVNRPGLFLAGYYDYFDKLRLQIMGLAEMNFLSGLSPEKRYEALDQLFRQQPPAVIVSRSEELKPFPEMQELARKHGVALLRSNETTCTLMGSIISVLNLELAPRITRHGVLVEVYGEGILILGDSGIGKSELAIELVKRGHRLVADDAVELRKVSNRQIMGTAPENIRHFIELRGIGIVNVALRPVNTTAKRGAIPADRTLSSIEGTSGRHAPKQGAPQGPAIGRMVDIEAKRAAGKGIGYEKWAKIHNLKQMAATHNFLTDNGLIDLDRLNETVHESHSRMYALRRQLRAVEDEIAAKKELQKTINDYRRTKPAVEAGRKLKGKKAEMHRQAYEVDYIICEAAVRRLKEMLNGGKIPAAARLKGEIEALISEKNGIYNEYRRAKDEYDELANVKYNAQRLMEAGQAQKHKKRSHEQER